ncbi:phage fiber-tail adaptor protein [Commensalibacter melissae]|uniref:phage fiber-tail adaptor protein n=1 Tax=Commensalibacter melissae TaxID=2070537 RepID=UPI0012D8C0AB|nr:hypothetical protein [Commensalibacter melissae]MUG08615.1 hypothetical protein [Commensalibacter melissae]
MVYDSFKDKINTRVAIPVANDTATDKDKPNNIQNNKETDVSQTDREIFELPGGCLGGTRLRLSCKGPTEKKFYSFSVRNRMLADDRIASVKVGSASDSKVMADKYTFQDQTFTVRLSGGELNRNVPLRCEITTEQEETLDFVCILPIREEGILYENPDDGIVVVMGATGVRGNGIRSIAMGNDANLEFSMDDGSVINVDTGLFRDNNGQIVAMDKVASLPDDFSINGSVFIAPNSYVNGDKSMPKGLSLDRNIVLTDGTVYYKHSINNGGVLCTQD